MMKMKKKYWIAIIALAVQTIIGSPDANASSRSTKKFGLSVGLLTEPFLSLMGYNVSYNIKQWVRVSAGYGSSTASGTGFNIDVNTIALDAKFFLLDWNFAPYLDVGYTKLSGTVTGTGDLGGLSLSQTGGAIYYGFGLDWQTYLGFNLGFNYKLMSLNSQSAAIPGFYAGWYF
jgi:hypothetical protein